MYGYSEDFKEKCKKVYPTFTQLHEALDEGREIVGRYLNDNINSGIKADVILQAKTLQELQEKAKLMHEQKSLYVEWLQDYDQ